MQVEQQFDVVGRRLPRKEAIAKVTGAQRYSGDISFPKMLHAKVLRSPYAHALVKKIDTSKAEKLPGVKAILTHQNVAQTPVWHNSVLLPGVVTNDSYIIERKARHVGDRIAAVAATRLDTAEKALDLIDVEYEELPAVFDLVEARKPDSPKVHDFVSRGANRIEVKNNILAPISVGFGDVEKGFKNSDTIVEEEYKVSRINNAPLERMCVTCSPTTDGRVEVWSTHQSIHEERESLARSLNMPPSRINVHRMYLGGSFGRSITLGFIEPICDGFKK